MDHVKTMGTSSKKQKQLQEKLRKCYLSAIIALRKARGFFGDSRVNFTIKLKAVIFPSFNWLSYLRTQLMELWAEFNLFAKQEIFLSAVFCIHFYTNP